MPGIAGTLCHESSQRPNKHAGQHDLKVVTILPDRGKRAQDEASEETGSDPEPRGPAPTSNESRDETGRESLEG